MLTFGWHQAAKVKWVSSESGSTNATRQMVYDLAVCILTASSGAGIYTLVSNTSFIWGAIRVKDAFGSAAFVGVPEVVGETAAGTGTILFTADRIRATGRRYTGGDSFY